MANSNNPIIQSLQNLRNQVSTMQTQNNQLAYNVSQQEISKRQGLKSNNGPQDVRDNLKSVLPGYMMPGNVGDVNKVCWPFWFTNITPLLPAAAGGMASQAKATVTITQEAAFIMTAIMKTVFIYTTTNTPEPVPPPPLGVAATYAVLGASAVTNTGASVLTGDLGVSPSAAITGFPPGIFTGTEHAADANAAAAQLAAMAAYTQAQATVPLTANLTGMDLGGLTLPPGTYKFNTSAQLTGTLILDGQGNPNSVWIFQIGSTLTTASASNVIMVNGGVPGNVTWAVGSSATLGTTTTFAGNILALASISLTAGATVQGSLYALTGAVTLISNIITRQNTSIAPGPVLPVYTAVDPNCCGQGILTPGLSMTLIDAQSSRNFMSQPLVLDEIGWSAFPTELPTPLMFLPNSIIETQLFNSNLVNSYIPWITFLGVRCRIEDAQRILSTITG